jgi:hypothetical protein
MATTSISVLKAWFSRGLKPLASQFAAIFDSFWHKDESIPMTSIDGLSNALNSKANADSVANQIADILENINIQVQDATTTQKGVVMLSDQLENDVTKAATVDLVARINTVLTELIDALTGNVYNKMEVQVLVTEAISGLDWKDGVGTFEYIATTYPAPEIGWLVPCQADGKIYKWNGTTWVDSYLSILSAALMKYNQDASSNPTFDGSRLALYSELPDAPADATTLIKGIVQLASDLTGDSDSLAATQGAVKRAIDSILSIIGDMQTAINAIELTPGLDAPYVQFQYSANGTSWHVDPVSTDIYFRTSVDGGTTWGTAVIFKGVAGASAYEDWKNISGNENKTFNDFLIYLQGGKFILTIDFDEISTYYFICPGTMTIDSVQTNIAATISLKVAGVTYTLGANLPEFTEVAITTNAICLVNLSCTSL